MKVLMQNRRDVFKVPGGDTLQMLKTKEYLEKNYDIKVEISNELSPDLSKYDIIHLFNVTRVHETYVQLQNAKRQNKKVVISPIYHSVEALKNYETYGRVGLIKKMNTLIRNENLREFIKNIAKSIKDPIQINSIITQLKMGYINQQKYVIENSDLIYVIANDEYSSMKRELSIENKNYRVVPNGVDFNKERNKNKDNNSGISIINFKDYILCVARIENRKNQIGLIKALQDSNFKIVFVGGKNPKQKSYFKEFMSYIDNNQFYYLGVVEHDELLELFQNAKVHVLPSWFEVVPLVDIEARVAGTNIVTTKYSYIKEYMDKGVCYCDPNNLNSIKEAVIKAYNQKKHINTDFEEMIDRYSWDNVVQECYKGYVSLLKG